jgi:isopenicillin N synthase-like dioxygenase
MRGFEGAGKQALDADTPPDLRERFYVGVDLDAEHPYVSSGVPNHGPNQWPALPGFREQNERYFAALLDLGRRVMRILALSLELEENLLRRDGGRAVCADVPEPLSAAALYCTGKPARCLARIPTGEA